jgi:HSP20 family protein
MIKETSESSSKSLPATRGAASFTDQLIEPLNRLRSEVDRLFDDFPVRFLTFPLGLSATKLPFPAVEMKENTTGFKLSVEVPGIDAKDVDVTIDEGVLVIKGEKKQEREEKEKGYLYSERSYGSFERRIALPANANAQEVKARAKDGVLQITIGKIEKPVESGRKIAIET